MPKDNPTTEAEIRETLIWIENELSAQTEWGAAILTEWRSELSLRLLAGDYD